MWDLKACTVCLSTDTKLFKIGSGKLKNDYYLVSGLKATECEGLPQYLCVECSAYVKRFKAFRDKCKRAHFTLKTLLQKNNEINTSLLKLIKCEAIGISPSLSYLNLNKSHYEEVKFQWVKNTRISITPNVHIPIQHYTTVPLENEFEVPRKRTKLPTIEVVKLESDQDDSKTVIENNINDTEIAINDEADCFFDDNSNDGLVEDVECKKEDNVDGSNFDVEYANMIPISLKEAKAVLEVYKMFNQGQYKCECGKSFKNEARFVTHKRMHDRHVSGSFLCELCDVYYRTEFLLKTHMTDKHMYKYVCRKCPEVSFDRMTAKHHFVWTHLQKRGEPMENWYDSRPSWLSNKGGKRVKGVAMIRPVKRMVNAPEDFPIYTPVSQEDQYAIVQERRKSRNYLEAAFKCEHCYRGFRETNTYAKHMKKHDPACSGELQCDMCKLHFRDTRKLYKHMNITHLFKYSCQTCPYVCYNRGQAHMHYKWHKNVKYTCPHCDKEFTKASTRLTHIRIKHPSMYICTLCGHSFVSENGLYCHKKLAHSEQEIESSEGIKADPEDQYYCTECKVQFLNEVAFKTHLGSSSKHATTNTSIKIPKSRKIGERRKRGRPGGSSTIINNGVPTATECEVCGKFLSNDVQARKHYESEHPGHEFLKRYMCDVCGHTTKQYANLMVHMRTHTHEKPYGCPHCGRRFSMPSNRDRHLVVHTGEKRYQCQHCSRRFTQSSAVKLHIQTVHLKIPYAPWDKKNRKRRKELEASSAPLTSISVAPPLCPPPAPPKMLIEAQADYLSAYITYSDE